MKIKFIKEYCTCFRDEENMINTETFKPDDTVSTSMEVDRYFTEELARWLINNGFAEEVKESGRWKPQNGEAYYSLNSYGSVSLCTCWKNDHIDRWRYSIGNTFKTEKATERCHDYLKAIAIVRQDEGVLTPDQLQEKKRDYKKVVFIGYDSMGRLATNPISLFSYDIIINAILFDNETHARASLDNHPDEWKIIANYDWSRE